MKKSTVAAQERADTTDASTPKYVEADLDLAELIEADETVQECL